MCSERLVTRSRACQNPLRDRGRVKKMADLVEKYVAGFPEPGEVGPAGDVDDETIKALRALGYLGSGDDE